VLIDVLLDSCPPGQVTAVMPAYQMVMFTVSLLSPLLATAMARSIGTTIALIVAAAFHFIGAMLFIALKIGRSPAPTPITPATPI
jgi:hypothetical protein